MAVPPGLIDLFVENLMNGMSVNMASKSIGVSAGWYSEHCKRDQEFAARCDAAMTVPYKDAVKCLSQEAKTDWRAAESYLKRKHRDEFGDAIKADIEISPVAQAILDMRKEASEDKELILEDDGK